MAAIKKRRWLTGKGEWKEAWRLRYTDGSGKERSKQFDRKGDAEAYRLKSGWEIVQGIHTPDAASITVADAFKLWIARARKEELERSTIKSYDEIGRLHILPLLGAEKLSRLTMPAVKGFIDALLETRSKAMAGKAVRALSSIITDAQERGLVAQNVARGVKVIRSKREKKKIVVPPKEDLRAMLRAAEVDYPDFHPLLLTAVFAGLRSSELRGLCRADVDLRRGEINVTQRADAWGEIGPPKSEAG